MRRPRWALWFGVTLVAAAAVLAGVRTARKPPSPAAPISASMPTAAPRTVATTPSSGATVASSDRTSAPVADDDPPGTLRLEGQVIDASLAPVKGATVSIDSVPPREITTEADGGFVFTELPSRSFTLWAHADDHAAGPVRVRLDAGTEPVILRVGPGARLRVRVRAEQAVVADAQLELRGGVISRATTDATGQAILSGLPPAWSLLVVRKDGFATATQRVDVRGAGEAPIDLAVQLVRGAPVSGRVVDASGAPVGGARVLARDVSQPLPVDDPRRDAIVTDATGLFTLPAVAAGTWRLTASAPGFAPTTSLPLTLDGTHARADVVLRLAPGASVRGVVHDTTGKPVTGADVLVVAEGHLAWRPRRAARTDERGRFALEGLAPGAIDVMARSEAAASGVVRTEAVPNPAELTLVLSDVAAIRGAVVDSRGAPLAEAIVEARPVDVGDPSTRAAWQVRGEPATLADGGGAFVLTGLPAGRYRVRAGTPGGAVAGSGVLAEPGGPPVRLVVADDGVITGRVRLAPTGAAPLYTVQLGDGPRHPGSADSGAFRIAAPAGSYGLTIAGPAFVARVVPVSIAPGAVTDLGDLEVTPGRAIRGVVVDTAGRTVADAEVAVGDLLTGDGKQLYIADESLGARTTTTGADGGFVLDGFGGGSLTIIAGKAGVGRSTALRLPASPGGAIVEIVLEPTSSLRGRVVRAGVALPDTIVIANPIGATAANVFAATGPDGAFLIEGLPPGAYLVQAMLGGGGGQPKDLFVGRVDVALGATAELELDATPGALALTVAVSTAPAMVLVIGGAITAQTGAELRDGTRLPLPERGTLPIAIRTALGSPVTIVGLRPGPATACAAVVSDPSADLDALPVRCTTVLLTAGAPTPVVQLTP